MGPHALNTINETERFHILAEVNGPNSGSTLLLLLTRLALSTLKDRMKPNSKQPQRKQSKREKAMSTAIDSKLNAEML